jgi:hypothetical protein
MYNRFSVINREVSIVRKYIRLFLNEKNPFDILYETYPEIRQDLTSARELVDCQCRSRVIIFLEEKIKNKDDFNLINSLLILPEVQAFKKELDDEFEQEIFELEKKIRRQNNARKIYNVSKDEEGWIQFIDYAKENIEFKCFSIIEREDYLEVRFI